MEQNISEFQKRCRVSIFTAKAEKIDTAKRSKKRYRPACKMLRTAERKVTRKLQHKVRAAKKRQLRTVVLIENGRCAALDEIAAHNYDKIVCPGQLPGFCQLISMAVMKRIIFCNDCGNGHKTYLLSKKIARFQTERNRGSHSPIVTKTEKECKNSSVLDFLSSCFEFYTCERAKSVLQ